MAFCLSKASKVSISIPRSTKNENYVSYEILCRIEDDAMPEDGLSWTVVRRYSDFLDMHDVLVQRHGVPKDLLPGKKFIGNFAPDFVEKRRADLEEYLKNIFEFLKLAQPSEVLAFLEFHRFEINCHLRKLANKFSSKTDVSHFECDPITLFAITERLSLPNPQPAGEDDGGAGDFCHILDFFSRLPSLSVVGSEEPLASSSVIPNKYDFSLGFVKSAETLSFVNCDLDRIVLLGPVRETVKSLDVHNCEVVSIGQILLCDMVHKEPDDGALSPECRWLELEELNARGNHLSRIDRSIKLAPKIARVDLSCNQLDSLDNLTSLPFLASLNLAFNRFSRLESLHLKLGQVTSLNLASNSITSLEGFQKLYSLVTLDLSRNKIVELHQVGHLGKLPCLENLTLTGNPVTMAVDYRTKSLLFFGDRAGDVHLDGQETIEKELDTIAVLRALEMAKDPNRVHPLLSGSSPSSIRM